MLLAAAFSAAQFGRPTSSKGPRALGLLELAPNGKGHLIPITIMIDGQFYVAGAYKASPVPMALDAGIVYEAERTGNSVGLFTITGALHGPNNSWVGAGKWQLPASEQPKKPSVKQKPHTDEDEGPPKLKRPESQKPSAPSTPPPNPPSTGGSAPAASPSGSQSKAPEDSNRPVLKRPESQAPAAASSAPAESEPPEDPNRPRLRRGKPAAMEHESDEENSPAPALPPSPAKTSTAKTAVVPAVAPIQLLPAISDAGGPEPRPFTYDMKPDEEQTLRKKVLALAAKELTAKVAGTANPAAEHPAPSAKKSTRTAATPQPTFDDVQLRAFDLTSNNEPVFVLSAKARLPQSKSPTTDYFITLVARTDLYGELHKAFSQITDTQHLDVLPRYELIDAVDADGDGRGELLFREVSDAGKAFAVYRVIGNQLWPLFEGTPQ